MEENKREEALFDALIKEAVRQYLLEFDEQEDVILDEESEARREESLEIVKARVLSSLHRERVKRKKLICLSAAVIALVSIIVCTVSVTAFRSHKFKTEAAIDGDIMSISAVNTDFSSEYDAITNFKHKNDIIVPGWLPEGTELVAVEDEENYVKFRYEIRSNYIDIAVWDVEFNKNTSRVLLEQNEHNGKKINILGLEGKMIKMKYENGITNTGVIFSSDNVIYEIVTDLPRKELNTLIKNLKYYK